MRIVHVVVFAIAIIALILALVFWSLDFWRIGMACLLVDVVSMMLWPDDALDKRVEA